MNEIIKKDCLRIINEIVGLEHSQGWWNSPNKSFGGQKPIDVLSASPQSVYSYLLRIIEGG